MKRTILLLLFLPVIGWAQITALHYDTRFYHASGTDTLKGQNTVTATKDSAKVQYLYQINISPASSDSVSVFETTHATGIRYLGSWKFSATPQPISVSFGPDGIVVDSAYVLIYRGADSKITAIYKTR